MPDDLAFDPADLWYIKIADYDSKFPADTWGGYSQSFVAADTVYQHGEVVESDHDHWAVCGCQDFDHGTVTTLVFDLDVHKAPEDFDIDRVTVPNDTLIVKSQNGGLHVYTKVHAERGELQESDFTMTTDPGWDIDIRGSAVSMHVVAPTEVPGVESPYEVVNDEDITAVTDPADAADRIRLDGEPLLEYDPGARAGAGVEIDRDVDPPEEMPTCYHRGLQLRAACPDDHPNTHKVNVLTALCGLAAGYGIDEMQTHFCEEYAPGEHVDSEQSRYHLQHIADHVDRGEYSPPTVQTLRDFGILDEAETCTCSIPYHGQPDQTRSAAEALQERVDGEEADSMQQAVIERVITPYDPPENADIEEIGDQEARQEMADILTEHHDFVLPREDTRGWRTTLYVYNADEGIYEPHGEAFLETHLERLLAPLSTNTWVNEIVGKVKRMSRVQTRRLEEPPEELVVGNGILNLTTGELREYSPTEYHRTKIDVDWDPDAGDPDRIDEFLHDVVEPEDVSTLYRLIAHTLYREYAAEKAAVLIGDGQNGKSVFLDLIETFVGGHNVSHRELQDLTRDEFAANNLQGKLANLATEVGDEEVTDMTLFKKLTGRDTMDAQVKHEKPITFDNYATLMFAANQMPRIEEDNHAVWRRWLLIRFPHTFRADDPEAKDPMPKRRLMKELTSEEQLQALLVRCQQEIEAWWGGRDWFADADSPEEVREEMKKASDPVYAFASACLINGGEDDAVRKDRVRECYHAFADEHDLQKFNPARFGEHLKALADFQIEGSRPRDSGGRPPAYAGIQLSNRGRQLLGLDEPADEDGQGTVAEFDQPDPLVYEFVRDEYEDEGDPVPKSVAIWSVAGDHGFGKTSVEQAVDRLKTKGELFEQDDGLVPSP